MLTRYKKQRKALKNSCERYQNLSQDEKNKKHQYGCDWYWNLSEKEKKEASIWLWMI